MTMIDHASANTVTAQWPAPGSIIENLTQTWNHTTLLLLTGFILYLIHVRYNSPLSDIPGPFLASLTRLWKVKTILTARQELVFLDLHKKHGKAKHSRTERFRANRCFFQVLSFA